MLNLSPRLSRFQIPPCFLHVAGLRNSQTYARSQSRDVNNRVDGALHRCLQQ
jgi:hypothetical protein